MVRSSKLIIALLFPLIIPAALARAQGSSNDDDLRKQIQALTETVKAMQKDLQEIKGMLQSRMPAPPPQNVVLDLAGHPARGEATARLTLVEFSDYQ
jgi:protein-disulfide isomerase